MKTSFLRELSAEDVFSITFTLGLAIIVFLFSHVEKPVEYAQHLLDTRVSLQGKHSWICQVLSEYWRESYNLNILNV